MIATLSTPRSIQSMTNRSWTKIALMTRSLIRCSKATYWTHPVMHHQGYTTSLRCRGLTRSATPTQMSPPTPKTCTTCSSPRIRYQRELSSYRCITWASKRSHFHLSSGSWTWRRTTTKSRKLSWSGWRIWEVGTRGRHRFNRRRRVTIQSRLRTRAEVGHLWATSKSGQLTLTSIPSLSHLIDLTSITVWEAVSTGSLTPSETLDNSKASMHFNSVN